LISLRRVRYLSSVAQERRVREKNVIRGKGRQAKRDGQLQAMQEKGSVLTERRKRDTTVREKEAGGKGPVSERTAMRHCMSEGLGRARGRKETRGGGNSKVGGRGRHAAAAVEAGHLPASAHKTNKKEGPWPWMTEEKKASERGGKMNSV